MRVYVVQHLHKVGDDTEDVKFIGVYSSEENALDAVSRLAERPGFSSAVDGFHVDEYEVDRDHWAEGYADCTGENLQ